MLRIVVLALALLGSASAGRNYNPSISVKVTDTKLNGLASLNLGGSVETDLSDNLAVGAEYDYNECENTPREVFARWRRNDGDGKLGVVGRLNLAQKSGAAEVSYSNGDTSINANLDTSNAAIVEEVELNHRVSVGGRGLHFSPKYESRHNRGSLRTRLELNDATQLELEGEMNRDRDAAYHLRVSHNINENNRVEPELNLKSGKMKYQWHRKLGGEGNALHATVNPHENVELEWEDNGARGAWTTKVNVPWGNAKDADVSFARKFNL